MNATTMIFVGFCAALALGAGFLYFVDMNDFDADVECNPDGSMDVTLHGNYPDQFKHVGYSGVNEVSCTYLYFDDGYGSLNNIKNEKELLSNLNKLLIGRGCDSAEFVDAQGLIGVMDDADCAVIMASGALPSTVFEQDSGSLFEEWLNAGGTLYWMGPELGKYRAVPGGVSETDAHFFPAGSVNNAEVMDYADRPSEWMQVLNFNCLGCDYGLKADYPGSLVLGSVSESGYSSLSAVGYGSGHILIAGLMDVGSGPMTALADMISMGLCEDSVLIENGTYSKGYGDAVFRIDDVSSCDAVYVLAGSFYSCWGERFIL